MSLTEEGPTSWCAERKCSNGGATDVTDHPEIGVVKLWN